VHVDRERKRELRLVAQFARALPLLPREEILPREEMILPREEMLRMGIKDRI